MAVLTAAALGAAGDPAVAQATAPQDGGVTRRQQIETDWLLQERSQARAQAVTPEEDAVGGCDGVRDSHNVGYYGFHTDRQLNAWWQVDLGRAMPLAEVAIYNATAPTDARRAHGIAVLLSTDGNRWTEIYRHDGKPFVGPSQPLRVDAKGATARLVRVQQPYVEYLHLEEIEVYPVGRRENVALGKPATQSSASKYSRRDGPPPPRAPEYPAPRVVERGLKLADSLRRLGVDVGQEEQALRRIAAASGSDRDRYLEARWRVRRLALANPLLDFDKLLFVKRAPNMLLCHCDEYLSWWSRPGGELCLLEGWRGDAPRLRSLTAGRLPPGDILRPDISYDGDKVLFAYCRHYPELWQKKNKLDKASIAEDAFYHLYEINLDGSGLRRLTRGRYEDFDGRYLPGGGIVFLSTRRGQFLQCGSESARETLSADLPDSFVRCGGNAYRPVTVHTLHVMDSDGGNMRAISPFESFEWNPSVANDGRILYARWDYVDRHRMWHMALWSTFPDGSAARSVFGNFTTAPYSFLEARSIPNSQKIIFTASAHHSHAGGSLVLLDPNKGVDGTSAMTRLTPEVVFPEIEGRPESYYANPYPLSEEHYLAAWSSERLWWHAFNKDGTPVPGPTNSLGVYLFDSFGNLNLIYRDPAISSMYPLPIRPRARPFAVADTASDGSGEGTMLVQDVYRGDLAPFARGAVQRLRIVGIPPKTQPRMDTPVLGVTHDDPGKFVLGTVPVEADGSAFFRVPAGLPFFVQALDARGMALQTMRSATYVQPGRTYACIGCHEYRQSAPPNQTPLAARRPPSGLTPGPEGSWPLDFAVLVQPILDRQCVQCHRPGAKGKGPQTDLTAAAAYKTLLDYGPPRSLRQHVQARYDARRSVAGAGAATTSPLVQLLGKGHYDVKLAAADWERLLTWMDTYGQRIGSFSPEQEERLRQLRTRLAPLLVQSAAAAR